MAPATLVLDLSGLRQPDVGTVEMLALMHVAAQRAGVELRLENPCAALAQLIELLGLDGVLRVEPHGQPEAREQPGGAEEERELGDPAA
jgi:anti-anti-sigma regulatory factor